jgi:hypothetical protein
VVASRGSRGTGCKKSPAEAAVMMVKVAELHCAILVIANIFKTAWVHQKTLFLKKKMLNSINNLRTVRSKAKT